MKSTRALLTTCPKCGKEWEGRFPGKARLCIRCGHEFTVTRKGQK